MADRPEHAVDTADERLHDPGPEEFWQESFYLDFVSASGDVAGYTRIGVYPRLGVSWWTTSVVGDGRRLVSSNDHGLALPEGSTRTMREQGGIGLRGEALSVDYEATDPLRTMTVRGHAPAALVDDPADVYRARPGTPARLDLDLSWATDGTPYHYEVTTRYEIPCRVSGEIVVDGERIAIEGEGQRDHSWGVRDWWQFGWCWAAVRLDDATRVHWADIRFPGASVGLGYVQREGTVVPVASVDVTESLGEEGLPSSAAARVEPGGLRLDIEPLWFGPALLEAPDGRRGRFPRAAARFRAEDGRSGIGWIEWNQPDLATSRA